MFRTLLLRLIAVLCVFNSTIKAYTVYIYNIVYTKCELSFQYMAYKTWMTWCNVSAVARGCTSTVRVVCRQPCNVICVSRKMCDSCFHDVTSEVGPPAGSGRNHSKHAITYTTFYLYDVRRPCKHTGHGHHNYETTFKTHKLCTNKK